jgi:hypothetical protein
MIQVDLTHDPAAVSRIVDRILKFLQIRVGIPPREEVPVTDLDLSAIPEEVDPVAGLALVSLDSDPSMDVPLPLDHILVLAASGANFIGGRQPLPALHAKGAIRKPLIDALYGMHRAEFRVVDEAFLVPYAVVGGRDPVPIEP